MGKASATEYWLMNKSAIACRDVTCYVSPEFPGKQINGIYRPLPV
ncbi:hypothetical protein [Mastigocoleus sp. MO_188.B34]|nr:hypothetical protein [Mastigocoleus sp. MO_188.B34]